MELNRSCLLKMRIFPMKLERKPNLPSAMLQRILSVFILKSKIEGGGDVDLFICEEEEVSLYEMVVNSLHGIPGHCSYSH